MARWTDEEELEEEGELGSGGGYFHIHSANTVIYHYLLSQVRNLIKNYKRKIQAS